MSKLERNRGRGIESTGDEEVMQILNKAVREVTSEEVTIEQRPDGVEKAVLWMSGRRAFQKERMARAKVLRQDHAQNAGRTAKRPTWLEQ